MMDELLTEELAVRWLQEKMDDALANGAPARKV